MEPMIYISNPHQRNEMLMDDHRQSYPGRLLSMREKYTPQPILKFKYLLRSDWNVSALLHLHTAPILDRREINTGIVSIKTSISP